MSDRILVVVVAVDGVGTCTAGVAHTTTTHIIIIITSAPPRGTRQTATRGGISSTVASIITARTKATTHLRQGTHACWPWSGVEGAAAPSTHANV